MKKLVFILVVMGMIFSAASAARAGEVSDYNVFLTPNPSDMGDLAHAYYYVWKPAWDLPAGEVITKASLEFTNIWDWTDEENDNLYARLMNKYNTSELTKLVKGGDVWYGVDNEAEGDFFQGTGKRIGKWSDKKGGYERDKLLTFEFDDELIAKFNDFMADGKFAIGIDPDCHYYNDGIQLKIATATAPVPEPISSTLFLLGAGAFGLRRFRRKK